MSARFECPQCQFVFVAKDAAFSDCPQCGSMAVPAGSTTSSDSAYSADVTAEDGPIASAGSEDLPPSSASGPGIFGAMFESDDQPSVPRPAVMSLPASLALTRGEDAATFDEPTKQITNQDIDSFDPFADVPDVGGDLSRSETRVQDVPEHLRQQAAGFDIDVDSDARFDEETRAHDSNPTIQIDPSLGAFDPSDDGRDGLSDDDGATLDNGPSLRPEDLFSDFPNTGSAASGEAPLTDMTSQPDMPPVQPSLDDVPPLIKDAPRAPAPPATASPQAVEGFWDPNYTSDEIQPGAVLLHQLEAQMHGAQEINSIGDLDDSSFDLLEQAFDDAALAPEPARPRRAENALLEASAALAMSSAALPINFEDVQASIPAPSAPALPPPLKSVSDLPHLSLSEDTLALCGLPIVDAEATSTQEGNLALALTRGAPRAEPPPSRPVNVPLPVLVSPVAPDDDDPALSVEVPVTPPTFAGFTPLRVFGLVVLFVVLGAGIGAFIAPTKKQDTSTRGLAAQKYARGNQAFVEGRYDEALGFYRGATSTDPTFVDAYRAKAIALAKDPDRQDEAAAAYKKYLEVAGPGSHDRAEVERILSRRLGDQQP